MRSRRALPVILLVLVSIGGLVATFVLDRRPQLGLDLQGGASVVLAPRGGQALPEAAVTTTSTTAPPGATTTKPETEAQIRESTLEQAIEIIRLRIDALGVAEPEITRQGRNILIQLPGVKDPDRILNLVGQTATLRFRPVLGPATPEADPLTPRDADKPDQPVVLAEVDRNDKEVSRSRLGPALADGTIIASAKAEAPELGGDWKVSFEMTGSGSPKFDEIAGQCNPPSATCPTGQLAIVLDGLVKSAPRIQESKFGGTGQITGEFTEREAKDLALVLRYGSLPVELETQQRQTVSPTLGRSSLRAGVFAGALGLALVLLYMIFYYRALGFVVLIGLGLSAALLYTTLTLLSVHQGLTLSLAGVIGVIVSVGVTVDSYVVYFERLHDEVRAGRTLRSSTGRSFDRAFRTILAGNATSFIGAAILYWLSVGPVRGFAFTLALSTVFDVVVTWMFTRPVVSMLGKTRFFTSNRLFGVARGLKTAGAPA